MAYVPRLSSQGMPTSRFYSVVPPPWNSIQPLNNYLHNTRHKGNCTSYCLGRWLEIANGDTSKMTGLLSQAPAGQRNGGNWYGKSPLLQAGQSNPQPGDIKVTKRGTQDGWGHVAVVEEVHMDTLIVSESMYTKSVYFQTETAYRDLNWRMRWEYNVGYTFEGFLRMGGASGGVVPSIQMPTEWINEIDYWIADGSQEEINNMVMAYTALKEADSNWSLEAICGVLGNMWRESHLNPGMREIGAHQNGGLVGWTPLTKWSVEANVRGIPWNDGNGQCEWVSLGDYWADPDHDGEYTLYHNHWVPGRMATPMTYAEYKQCTDTPEECAKHFMEGYEGPSVPALHERQEKARYYYQYLLGNLPFMTDQLPPPEPPRLFLWGNKYFDIKLR